MGFPQVEEKREEIRVKQELVDVFPDINPPNPTPSMRPIEEVIIKKEFIE